MSTSNNLYAEFGEYKWPSTLYEELSDQAKLSQLVYSFARVFEAARKAQADGVDFYGIDPTDIHYSITPGELKVVLEQNAEYLEQEAEFDAEDVAEKGAYLQAYQDEADASNIKNAIALEYFNDTFADREALYAITRDSIKKRITVVYRGSVTRNNWLYNFRILQTEVDMPTMLQKEGGENEKKLYFHTGFYKYVFDSTKDRSDEKDKTKYAEIKEQVKTLLTKYPDHKVYTTGHSLGGGLANITGFYFATEDDLPKPITVLTFAAPRVAGSSFRDAFQLLEKKKLLRSLRTVNENDNVPTIPPGPYYHVGFQLTCHPSSTLFSDEKKDPDLFYVKPHPSWYEMFYYKWTNGILSNLNFVYDHGMDTYTGRLEEGKDFVEAKDLNQLYIDENLLSQPEMV